MTGDGLTCDCCDSALQHEKKELRRSVRALAAVLAELLANLALRVAFRALRQGLELEEADGAQGKR